MLSTYAIILSVYVASPIPCSAGCALFHNIYDPETAIRTLASLVTDFPKASLTMIGPDNFDGTLQAASDFKGTSGDR